MIRTTIELSIEQLELILDELGPEQPDEHHTKKELRDKLRETLLALREKHAQAGLA